MITASDKLNMDKATSFKGSGIAARLRCCFFSLRGEEGERSKVKGSRGKAQGKIHPLPPPAGDKEIGGKLKGKDKG
jgi:hypothetical protein